MAVNYDPKALAGPMIAGQARKYPSDGLARLPDLIHGSKIYAQKAR
jgi:hypothetical protein